VFERLIIEANHSCKRIPYKDGTKLVKRGEKLTSIRQIANWVGWYQRGIFRAPNPKTISKILDWMIKNDLIEIYDKGNSQETHYNIVNYCVYQSVDDVEGNAKVTVRGSVSKQSVDTNNNVNNAKNVNNVNSLSSKVFADEEIPLVLAKEFFNLILTNNPKAKQPNFQIWAKQIDVMMRNDNRTEEDTRKVITWSQQDNFWMGNTLSPKSLRKQFDTLLVKMRQQQPKQNTCVEKNMYDEWREKLRTTTSLRNDYIPFSYVQGGRV